MDFMDTIDFMDTMDSMDKQGLAPTNRKKIRDS